MKKYQVIGGQYHHYNHGESDTLHGAKIIATKNIEHWDNWQGWHKPSIYLAEDTVIVDGFYGTQRVPMPGTYPVLAWDDEKKLWRDPNAEV